MAAPSNQSAGTAIDLGTLPASVSQNVHDAGTTYTVWYKYTALSTELEIGIFGFGDLSVYKPKLTIYSDAGSTVLLNLSSIENKPVQFPTVSGTTYHFEFVTNSGNPTPAVLLIEAETASIAIIPAGSILVNDDTDGFPAVILSSSDASVLNFIAPFVPGEGGDILRNGISCFFDFADTELQFYNSAFDKILTVSGGSEVIRTCHGVNRFYVATGASPVTVKTYDDAGLVDSTFSLTAIGAVRCIAALNDETILYYSLSASGSPIAKWDLVAGSALTQLAAGDSGYFIVDILVLANNTIIALFHHNVTGDLNVKRYNVGGTLLNTYALGVSTLPSGTFSRLAYAIDDPNSFWVMSHDDSATLGITRFRNIKASDGTILTNISSNEYETGIWNSSVIAAPGSRFGNSFSCPFVIIRRILTNETVPGNTDGSLLITSSPTAGGIGGLYKITPDKTNDTLWVSFPNTTSNVKIPNPTWKTGLIGE